MSHNYLDCIGEEEVDRLRAQHEAWLPETHSVLMDSGFSGCSRIVEFGCGPGFSVFDLARLINPAAKVTALDISDYYLNYIRKRIEEEGTTNIEVVQANAIDPLEFTQKFDAAFCRWFLAWVTKDIQQILTNINDSLKTGGTFVAMEYLTLRSTVHSPVCETLPRYLEAWETFYADAGGTTEIGAMLPELIKEAGFKIEELRCVGGYSPVNQRLYNWWRRLYFEFREKFLEKGLMSSDEINRMDLYWNQTVDREDSFIYSPVLLQVWATKC